jgi:hypothetical protein
VGPLGSSLHSIKNPVGLLEMANQVLVESSAIRKDVQMRCIVAHHLLNQMFGSWTPTIVKGMVYIVDCHLQ